MDIKPIPVHLTKEEHRALFEAATRECRRPPEQIRWLLRRSLGLTSDQPTEPMQNAASGHIRQDLATNSVL